MVGDDDVHVVVDRPAGNRNDEFTAFMASSADALFKTAYLLCGDAHRAEELTQQTLERTYRAWPRAREGDPLSYARRILVNLRIDTWRRVRREVLTDPASMPDSTATGPDEGHGRDDVVRALVALPLKQRRVVVLRHLLDLSETQVAAELEIPIGTVKSTAARAMTTLRSTLGAVPNGSRP